MSGPGCAGMRGDGAAVTTPSLILLGRPYDRAAALLDGRILVGKKKLRCELAADTLGSFRRLQNDDAVLAGEMSLGVQVASGWSGERSRVAATPHSPSRPVS